MIFLIEFKVIELELESSINNSKILWMPSFLSLSSNWLLIEQIQNHQNFILRLSKSAINGYYGFFMSNPNDYFDAFNSFGIIFHVPFGAQ